MADRRSGTAATVRQRAQGATRARMLREMLEALDALCAAAPLLLVLEDLHWADDPTLDLLDAVLRRREPARLLVLGTYRPPGPELDAPAIVTLVHELSVRGRCTELAVPRLDAAAWRPTSAARFPGGRCPKNSSPCSCAARAAIRSS